LLKTTGLELSPPEPSRPVVSWETVPRFAILAGPAGVGKTHTCLDHFLRLVEESKDPLVRDILYILPSAEHRERILDLMLRRERSGFFGERVVTFNRLMHELLKAGDFSLVTDVGRRFLIEAIVEKGGGEYFSSVSSFPGFLERIAEFVGELKESMVGLRTFRQGAKRLEKGCPELKGKYEGLLQIYEAYETRLEAGGLRDYRDGLFLLRERESRPKTPFPSFRHLFVDGFFDFSRSQLEFLHWLAGRSERVTLALTVDLSEERRGLFKIPLETLKELEKLGFQRVDLSREANYRTGSSSLRHIERNLFRPLCPPHPPLSPSSARGGSAEPFGGGGEGKGEGEDPLLILEATGIRGEIEMIAREIRALVRLKGIHFSDIALLLRRIGEYEGVVRTVFREFDIPVEIHERERLRDAPLARTLVHFFQVLLDDWKRADLFNFLKSSYVDWDYERVCLLEMRALDLGILKGRDRWLKEIGGPLFEKIRDFQDRFLAAKTVEEWIRLTQEVIRSFGLSQILPVYEEKARRDFATLKRLGSLLEEIRSSTVSQGTSPETFKLFAKEFLGLIEVDLFSLHGRDKNRVQVYDISLARQKEYKVVFVAGLLEKVFPAEIREDPILSDEERRIAGLKERLPRQAVERYLFYLALTRAREKLILSYPRFDLEGHEALPSFYVDEVKALFETPLPTRSYPVSQSLPRLEEAVEEREVAAHLIGRLYERVQAKARSERVFTLSLYNRFLERAFFRTLLSRVLFDPRAKIESEAVQAAFLPKGGIFKPTGLEAYSRCPYRYFAGEILGLEEGEEGIDAKQVGILLHEVLEDYWRERVEKERKELENLDEAKSFVKAKLHELLARRPLRGERAYRIELKKAEMEEWLFGVVEREIEEGSPLPLLRPRYFEFRFGFRPKEVDYLRLHDFFREDLLLRGKIDRIDIDPSGKYALVIDYKTGSKFQARDLEWGIALQLPLYLMAIQQLLKLKPVGGEIYQISSAQTSGFYAREGLEETGSETRSRAVFDRKDFDKILERTVLFSQKFAEGIKHAEIPVRPRDCDPHCPFPALCRIEKWRLPFIYQEIREEDKRNGVI